MSQSSLLHKAPSLAIANKTSASTVQLLDHRVQAREHDGHNSMMQNSARTTQFKQMQTLMHQHATASTASITPLQNKSSELRKPAKPVLQAKALLIADGSPAVQRKTLRQAGLEKPLSVEETPHIHPVIDNPNPGSHNSAKVYEDTIPLTPAGDKSDALKKLAVRSGEFGSKLFSITAAVSTPAVEAKAAVEAAATAAAATKAKLPLAESANAAVSTPAAEAKAAVEAAATAAAATKAKLPLAESANAVASTPATEVKETVAPVGKLRDVYSLEPNRNKSSEPRLDPFCHSMTIEMPGSKYIKMLIQHTIGFDGYVAKIEEGTKSSESAPGKINETAAMWLNPSKKTSQNSYSYSDKHDKTDKKPVYKRTDAEGIDRFDAMTKLVGEGSRFMWVRENLADITDHTEYSTLARADDINSPILSITFENLWIKWKKWFNGAYNIPNSEIDRVLRAQWTAAKGKSKEIKVTSKLK